MPESCPVCNQVKSESAARCTCGYRFTHPAKAPSSAAAGEPGWYYRSRRGSAGPLTFRELQSRVVAGLLLADDEVRSPAAAEWVRVGAIDQLRKHLALVANGPAEAVVSATEAITAAEYVAHSPDDAEVEGLPLPVIRVRSIGYRAKEVVRITRTGLRRTTVRGDITEECLVDPKDPVEKSGANASEIPWDSVVRVKRQRVGFWSTSVFWTRFTVETVRGNCQFRVPDKDVQNVNRALQVLAGERFVSQVSQRMSVSERVLQGAGAATILCFVLAYFLRSWATFWFGFAIGSVALITLLVVSALRHSSPAKTPAPPKRKRKRRAEGKPFRSQVLGWVLKVIGISWIILIFATPWVDQLIEKLPTKGSSSSNPYIYYVLFAPGFVCLRMGYKLCLRTFEPYRHADPRAPVVFLRGFDDDNRGTLQPNNLLARMHGIESLGQVSTGEPKFVQWLLDRGDTWKEKKDFANALKDYDEAIRIDAAADEAWNAKAWLLATCPDEKVRDGKKAVELATRACELDGWTSNSYLSTLAAARAEAGDFEEAIKWQEKALSDKDYAAKFGEECRKRLKNYKDKKPWRDE